MAAVDGKIVTDPNEVLKVWCSQSSDIATGKPSENARYDEAHRQRMEGYLAAYRAVRLRQPELDSLITELQVFTALRRMKAGKAPGYAYSTSSWTAWHTRGRVRMTALAKFIIIV